MAEEDCKGLFSPLAWRIAHACCEFRFEEDGPCPMPHMLIASYAQGRINKHRLVLSDMAGMLKHLCEDPSLFDVETTYLWIEALEYIVGDITKAADLKTEGWVYFIQCGEYVKIGLSGNVEARFKALQTATPYPLSILKKLPVPDMARAEARLHNYFTHSRHRGEWFRLTEEVLFEIESFSSIDIWHLPEDENGVTKPRQEDVAVVGAPVPSPENQVLVSEAVS